MKDKYAFGCLESGVVPRFCSRNCQRCSAPCNSGAQRQVGNYRMDKRR